MASMPQPECNPLWPNQCLSIRNMPQHLQPTDATSKVDQLKSEQHRDLLERRHNQRKGRYQSNKRNTKQRKLTEFATDDTEPGGEKRTRLEDAVVVEGSDAMNEPCSSVVASDGWLVIQSLVHRYALLHTLYTLRPSYIVLYNCDLYTIRQIEWYKSCTGGRLRLYWLMSRASTEEHRYLSWLRIEQEAFEKLIHERGNLLISREYDVGRDQAMCRLTQPVNTRQAGGQQHEDNDDDAQPVVMPTVVVDIREFNSELPLVLYKRGIEVVPVTLEIGDYIVTPDVAVERKALADLTQSLINGRVYTQAQQMSDHYARPMLLIEGGVDKKVSTTRLGAGPFRGELSKKAHDVREKLALLCRQMPRLRLIWARDAGAAADLFEEIKLDRAQPDVDAASTIHLSNQNLDLPNSEKQQQQQKLTPLARRWVFAMFGNDSTSAVTGHLNMLALCQQAASQSQSPLPRFLTTDFRKK